MRDDKKLSEKKARFAIIRIPKKLRRCFINCGKMRASYTMRATGFSVSDPFAEGPGHRENDHDRRRQKENADRRDHFRQTL